MKFPQDFLDEIRNRVAISTVIGERVKFDSKKSNSARGDYWACCPFHSEKTPSFHCDDRKGRYHCFGCAESGDQFRFVMQMDGVSFQDAVERLARKAGLQLPEPDPMLQKKEAVKADLYQVMELASNYFQQMLQAAAGHSACEYLIKRGITDETIASFRLGYAPAGRTSLIDYLTVKGIKSDQLQQCGLIVNSETGKTGYDRFRDRIMFPITDLKGRVVAFGGRALDPDNPAKYLNSPTTELFHKSRTLYHGAEARRACRANSRTDADAVIVVEGYMDVIALDQAAIKTAVAPLGTALTDEQIELVWQFSHQAIFCFDGDTAGRKAAYRALERALPLLKPDLTLRFALLPEGLDPDDIINRQGHDAMRQYLTNALSLSDVIWLKETQGKTFTSPEQRALLEKKLRQNVNIINDPGLRHYFLLDIKQRLYEYFRSNNRKGSREKALFSRHGASITSFDFAQTSLITNFPLREAAILLILVNHPELWERDFERLSRLEFRDEKLKLLHRAMLDVLAEWNPDNALAMRELLNEKIDSDLIKRIEHVVTNAGIRSALNEAPLEDAQAALNQAVHLHLRADNLNKRLKEIEEQLLENPDENVFAVLREVKLEIEETEDTQALIDGFGCWLSNVGSD